MSQNAPSVSRPFASAALLLMATVLFGCHPVSPGAASSADPAANASVAAGATGSNDPGISLQCMANRIQKASAPFHWSFKKVIVPDTNADWEADITGDAIAGTLIDSSGTHTIHGTRSDMTSWNTAVMILTSPLPASTFALVDNSSAIARVGNREVNGEQTTAYVIDTSKDAVADASLIKSVLGANGSIKGSAWVTQSGCPVRFVLDVEQFLRDGSVQKEHYEEKVTIR